ncbi:hypothetical protein BaRGS_00012159 [Batillaria attramentaria]|uniref:CWH43-like N-terminal domain-containing protein n=1 Tax=Batillaria attramentaria TaxID=370345 RepID=A0ABD0LAV6_9CAEN
MEGCKGAEKAVHFTVRVSSLLKWTSCLPLGATLFSVLWSVAFDFERSTATHCKVYNLLPTISSAIGGFTPQRYVWRICIAMHVTQRVMIALAYYSFHTSVPAPTSQHLYNTLAAVNSLLHVVEIVSLVGLSMISSTENGTVHENLFICFMVTGLSYMLLTIVLMRWARFSNDRQPSVQDVTSLRYKTNLFLLNIATFGIAVYFYFRHNAHCEPGVYTLYAGLEYVVVLTNILFHSTCCLDFRDYDFGVVRRDLVPHEKEE